MTTKRRKRWRRRDVKDTEVKEKERVKETQLLSVRYGSIVAISPVSLW